ncbi:MAG: tRNA (N6-isopentenyl adenosine(37)-C2)-methylthiotransferase MiaB [Planctomycetota bacterium]|nr:MAG: tRNA (N6-isopentenyl adenosine(37)-C2)-methylthiotransferase MiaB [Planctomycetota bacterium]
MTAPPAHPPRKVYFETFGCQMNKLDSELALQALARAGFTTTDDVRDADLVVLNTCSVREHAEHRVLSRLGRLKPGGPVRKEGALVAVTGCMAQRQGRDLLRRAPQVDIVAGTKEFVRLPELYADVKRERRPLAAVDQGEVFDYPRDPRFRSEKHRAWISIMRGCDLHCTYCIVPTTRGPEESRPLADVLDEARRLVDDGVVEITLLGQTVNSWGKQLPGSPDLADLLCALDELPGLLRTRFVTSHPNFFRNGFWERIRGLRTFCPYVHVPAQHGSDRILKRMARLYTTDGFRAMAEEARAAIPDLVLASDWIVGFPGETEEDHERSKSFLREIGFPQNFVFKYSPRPTTPSERRFADDVPDAVKARRCNELLDIHAELSHAYNLSFVDRAVEVLVEGPSKTNAERLFGRTQQNRIVIFDGSEDLVGRLVSVRVEAVSPHSLYGTLCEPSAPRRSLPLAGR